TVYPFAGAREAATNENETDVLVFHGATDAPEVSVWETGVGAGELFTFGYGEFAGYLELGTLDYVLEVRTADGETTVVAYSAPLQTLGLEGAAITVVASGFLNPANNSDGPAFGLYVATAAGGDLIALPVFTNVNDIVPAFGEFNAYPNPVRDNLNIALNLNRSDDITIEIFNIIGSRVYVNELGNRSELVMETINVSSLPQGTYILNVRTSDDVITRKINIVK
ncbi:MAG: T9SS type A sorting domain-containing protein, partial [Bacteroidales bacterium]